jgi:RNA polymerase sigma-70 factor (ECF subfamily)
MSRTSKSHWIIEALERHERALLRYATWAVGDLEAARELVQETFLRLCREDPARVEGHVAQWLFTVCRNLAFDARRKEGRMTSLDNVEIAVAPGLDEQHDADHALGRILAIVDTLPTNQREVIYLKFQADLSYKEIAEITHLSVSNVGFLIHTAVRTIRTHLQMEPDRKLRK